MPVFGGSVVAGLSVIPRSVDNKAKTFPQLKAALAARAVSGCDILAIGDSITECTGASTFENRWVYKLPQMLRASFPTDGVVGALGSNYIPALNNSTTFANGWTYGGTFGPDGSFGYGHRTIVLTGPSGSAGYAQRTVFGTSINVAHMLNTSLGTYTVSVDGAVVATVNSATGATSTTHAGGRSGLISLGVRGSHVVKITWSAGNQVYVNGIFLYDQDETTGIRFVESGQHGSKTQDWSPATNGNQYTFADDVALFNPDFVIIELMPNDMIGNVASSSSKTNILALIAQLRAADTVSPDILLIAPYEVGGVYTETWQNYVDKFREIAAADSKVWLLDLSAIFPKSSESSYGLVYNDGVHLNDAGNDLIARTIYNYVIGDKSLVGLSNVDNTSDAAKPISLAQKAELAAKATTSDIQAALAAGVAEALVEPSDYNMLGWTMDPAIAGSSTALVAGVATLCRVKTPVSGLVSGISLQVATAGVALSNSYVALYDPTTGARLAVSTDQSTSWQGGGYKDISFASNVLLPSGYVLVAILVGAGTTLPAFSRGPSSNVVNAGLAAPNFRFATIGTGLTALPSTFTLSGMAGSPTGYFVGLSTSGAQSGFPAAVLNINGRGSGLGGWWDNGIGFRSADAEGVGHQNIDPTTIAAGYSRSPYLNVNGTNDGVRARIYADGGKTANSTHPRSELREYKNSTIKASWDASFGTHVLDGWHRVTAFPTYVKKTSLVQMHDAAQDTLQIRCEEISTGSGTYRWTLKINGTFFATLITSYTLSTWVHWRVEVIDGVLRVYINGAVVVGPVTPSGWGPGNYFKVGNYYQGVYPDDGNAATEFCEVEYRTIVPTHSPAL